MDAQIICIFLVIYDTLLLLWICASPCMLWGFHNTLASTFWWKSKSYSNGFVCPFLVLHALIYLYLIILYIAIYLSIYPKKKIKDCVHIAFPHVLYIQVSFLVSVFKTIVTYIVLIEDLRTTRLNIFIILLIFIKKSIYSYHYYVCMQPMLDYVIQLV